jgi:Leucine-rich repeat (LRR) protein
LPLPPQYADAVPDECDWLGVTCDGSGPVITGLNLTDRALYLTGTLPPRGLSLLTDLRALDVSDQRLRGAWPVDAHSSLTNLRHIDVGQNQFTRFFGDKDGAHSIANLSNLQVLRANDNRLQEEIPPAVRHLTALREINVKANAGLAGPLFEYAVPNWRSVERIVADDTAVSGGVPDTAAGRESLRNLRELSAQDCSLAGTLPESLGAASNLEVLAVGGNDWTGTLPPGYAALTSLVTVSFANGASLRGTLPDGWGDAWTNVAVLDLHGNRGVAGPIPRSWGGMTNLRLLRLVRTGVTGTIPTELGRLTALAELRLLETHLSGTMPSEICALRRTGSLQDLLADCEGKGLTAPPRVQCDFPTCCTECFVNF